MLRAHTRKLTLGMLLSICEGDRAMRRSSQLREPVPAMASERARGKRPQVRGRFLFSGDEKLRICGVTYGTFRPDESQNEFHPVKAARAEPAC